MPKPTRLSQCSRCQASTALRRVEHPYWQGSRLVAVIHNVPAHVCRSCGFQHFDPAVQATMDWLVRDYIRMGDLFPIPFTVYPDTLRTSARN
jgi:YgiT-type zinc finger domain-containing protein